MLAQRVLKRRARCFPEIQSPQRRHIKILYLQCVNSFQVPFSASRCGKCFSPHFVPCFAVASIRDSPAARVPFAAQAVIPKQRMDLLAPRLRQAGVGSIPAAISNEVIS